MAGYGISDVPTMELADDEQKRGKILGKREDESALRSFMSQKTFTLIMILHVLSRNIFIESLKAFMYIYVS